MSVGITTRVTSVYEKEAGRPAVRLWRCTLRAQPSGSWWNMEIRGSSQDLGWLTGTGSTGSRRFKQRPRGEFKSEVHL